MEDIIIFTLLGVITVSCGVLLLWGVILLVATWIFRRDQDE